MIKSKSNFHGAHIQRKHILDGFDASLQSPNLMLHMETTTIQHSRSPSLGDIDASTVGSQVIYYY